MIELFYFETDQFFETFSIPNEHENYTSSGNHPHILDK